MIDSKIQTNNTNTSTQIDAKKCNKYKTNYYLLEGIFGGLIAGEAYAWLAPQSKDTFEKTEKEMLKQAAPIAGKNEEWNKLIRNTIENQREEKFGFYGMLAGCAIALFLIYTDKNKSQSEKT